MVLVLFAFSFLMFALGIAAWIARGIVAKGNAPQPRYVFRFNEAPGANTVRGLPSGAAVSAETSCPFCKGSATALATADHVVINCPDCGTLRGTAITPGIAEYSIPLPKV